MRDPWFPAVLILAVVLAAWLSILGPLPGGVGKWINDWQNLIAAIIAIIAAGLAYRNATQQLIQNDRQERNRRSRKHASVRAMLPLALSQIMEYGQRSASALLDLTAQVQGPGFPRGSLTNQIPQQLPTETLAVLAEFIEYSDDIDASLAETMVAWIQIHDARVRGLVRDNDQAGTGIVTRIAIEGSVIDAASIYAAAAALFDYSRRRTSHPPTHVSWNDVRCALSNMRIFDHDHLSLYKMITGREQRTGGPFDGLAP